jgi:hypothetical protein
LPQAVAFVFNLQKHKCNKMSITYKSDNMTLYVPNEYDLNCEHITVTITDTGDHQLKLIQLAKKSGCDKYDSASWANIYLPQECRKFKSPHLTLS